MVALAEREGSEVAPPLVLGGLKEEKIDPIATMCRCQSDPVARSKR
jgi:hypothetical protein